MVNFEKEKKTEFDFKETKEMILETFPKIQSARNQDIVLVVGTTGAGKSTLVNYLIGCKMKQTDDDLGEPRAEVEGKEYAEIGHKMKACTFNAEIFHPINPNEKHSFAFCDFPGFNDTGTSERKIAISLNREYMINVAENIKGIIVVIPISALSTSGRGKEFKELIDTITKLFKDVSQVSSSILFVITKAKKNAKVEGVVKKVSEILDTETNNYVAKFQKAFSDAKEKSYEYLKSWFKQKELTSSPSSEESNEDNEVLSKSLYLFELMKTNPGNIIIGDIFDDGGKGSVRDKIAEKILTFKPISKMEFIFNKYEKDRMLFEEAIYRGTSIAISLIEKKISNDESVEYIKKQIKNTQENLDFCANQIFHLQKPLGEDAQKEIESEIETLEKKISKFTEVIQISQKDIETLQLKINSYQSELKKLDCDTPIIYWEDQVNDPRSGFFFLLGKTKRSFNYYQKIPFTHVDEKYTHGHGKLIRNSYKPEQGIYQSFYESNRGDDGVASVKLYVKTKDEPKNVIRIQYLKEEIIEKQKRIDDLKITNTAITEDIEELMELKGRKEAVLTGQKKQEKQREEELVSHTERLIPLKNNLKNLQEKLNDYQDTDKKLQEVLTSSHEQFKDIYQILLMIKMLISNPITDKFLELYTKFNNLHLEQKETKEERMEKTISTSKNSSIIPSKPTIIPASKKSSSSFFSAPKSSVSDSSSKAKTASSKEIKTNTNVQLLKTKFQ